MLTLEDNQYLNDHPRFNKKSFKKGQSTPTDSYSFCINKDGKFVNVGSSVNIGCHAFVKQRTYGAEYRLCVVLPDRNNCCFYTNKEVEEYINLLKEIGFDIEFEGQMTHTELEAKHGKKEGNSTNNLVFTLGENYKAKIAENRYTVLCYLRCLWSRWSFWLPYRFIEFNEYFKKRKIKPSLSKILVLANLCPYGVVSDSYQIEAGTIRTLSKSNCDNIITENGLMAAYYGFIGHAHCNLLIPVGSENDKTNTYVQILNSFTISLLLVAPNNFNLVNYIETIDNTRKNKAILQQGENRNDIGKTRLIVDYDRILTNKLRGLLKEKQYYKAFLYLKEVAQHYTQFPDNHFSKVNASEIQKDQIHQYFQINNRAKANKFIEELDIKEEKTKKWKKTKVKTIIR